MTVQETIKAMECCAKKPSDCAECPEQGPGFGIACRANVMNAAEHHLKELQKTVDKWKVAALEACDKACFNCEEYYSRDKACSACHVMKIREEAAE